MLPNALHCAAFDVLAQEDQWTVAARDTWKEGVEGVGAAWDALSSDVLESLGGIGAGAADVDDAAAPVPLTSEAVGLALGLKCMRQCLTFMGRFINLPLFAAVLNDQSSEPLLAAPKPLLLRTVFEEAYPALLKAITRENDWMGGSDGAGPGKLSKQLRFIVGHMAAIVGTVFVENEPTWLVRERSKITHIQNQPPPRTLREALSDLMTEESSFLCEGSDEERAASLAAARESSLDRMLITEYLQTQTYVSVSEKDDMRSGTWSRRDLRVNRQRQANFLTNHMHHTKLTTDCTKRVPQRHNLLHGCFQIVCMERGCPCGNVVLIFVFMPYGESPEFAFHLLRERFGGRLPKYFLYDNACHLGEFARRRDPLLFCRVIFLIDRLHAPNHITSCSPAYRLKHYNGHSVLGGCLSESCEEVNAQMQRYTASTVRHMILAHAMLYMILFFGLWNDRKNARGN